MRHHELARGRDLRPDAAPGGPGEVVAVRTENSGPAQLVSFGQAFKAGAVPNGATLRNAQLDVKTRHGDGSARFGVVTLQVPAGTATTMLALGTPLGGVVSLPVALASENITVTLSGGVTATLDIGQAIGTSTDFWLRGPLATQARVDIPVVGALHVIADVTAYADGRIVTDLTFANDYAMGPTGGTRSYTATIRRNGAVVYTSPALTHYQYQQWRWTDRGTDVNVQADVRYLLATGVLPNYDVGTASRSRPSVGHLCPAGRRRHHEVHADHGRPGRHRPDHQRQCTMAAQPGRGGQARRAGAGERGGEHPLALLRPKPRRLPVARRLPDICGPTRAATRR